ncbi:hypothetical protein [Streptomyces sp. NPDC048057]|uniref:hypothetical protein n=1 Tax=Streptomyces sp. NPDC048057 TaxID=3155628 RepID=UPI0033E18B73
MTRRDSGGRGRRLADLAGFAAAVTVSHYLLGLLLVGFTVSEVGSGADSTPMAECRYTSNRPAGTTVVGHDVRVIPLHIMCRTTDGRVFNSQVVPNWFNPALAGSAATTAALTAGALIRARQRATGAPEQATDDQIRSAAPTAPAAPRAESSTARSRRP